MIGPALLALKHGIKPEGLIEGILAGFEYFDKVKRMKISDEFSGIGVDEVLVSICGLEPHEELFWMIRSKIKENDEK